MTGFGAADGVVGDARASVEIRTVNHRFFSPNLKLPAAFARWGERFGSCFDRELRGVT